MSAADEFAALIAATLKWHPDYLPEALLAISRGMQGALDMANARASVKDQAMMAALCFASKGRVTGDLRDTFLQKIAAAIDPVCASPIEKEFLALAKATGK